jgi:hypothetical protein
VFGQTHLPMMSQRVQDYSEEERENVEKPLCQAVVSSLTNPGNCRYRIQRQMVQSEDHEEWVADEQQTG